MGQMVMVIDRRGSSLAVGAHASLVLEHADGPAERVGVAALAEVVVHGDVALSSAVLRLLADHGVPLTCLPLRGGGCCAHLVGLPTRRAALRHAQHRALADTGLRLELARLAVQAKLDAANRVRVGLGLPASTVDLARAADLDTLRGLEGAAAAAYWAAFAHALPPEWAFPGRRRRPAPDPVNALLSLGYTLLLAPASALLHAAGLDPQLGFLHGESRQRPALALDLIEAARPLVDAFVRQLLASGELLPAHFHAEAGESRLTAEGRRVFYPQWYATAEAWRAPMAALLQAWRTRLLPSGGDLD